MEDREAKRRYLHEHILNKGYNVEDFVEYMLSLRGNVKSNNREW